MPRQVEVNDLTQAGVVGLLEAARRYERMRCRKMKGSFCCSITAKISRSARSAIGSV
jgi:DNA-directed RNA polymerase specialized sigma subunit